MPTFHPTTCKKGFTLIEMMIVLLLLSIVTTLFVARFSNRGPEIRKTVRGISVISHQLLTYAKLQQRIYRLVIEMNDDKSHRYFIESAPANTSIKRAEELTKETDPKKQDKDEKNKSAFNLDSSIIRGVLNLPIGLYFQSVEIGSRNEKITSGRAYIYYLPQGLADESVIQLGDKDKLHWSIVIHPLTGYANIVNREVSLQEVRQQ